MRIRLLNLCYGNLLGADIFLRHFVCLSTFRLFVNTERMSIQFLLRVFILSTLFGMIFYLLITLYNWHCVVIKLFGTVFFII